ncbi:uncharacterized protein LOC132744567, partial [Ruditapes philippinarum]|uniref:uncharacterized protein LOC132744567 n=1 Tax=Ruditapes philippinarum TaxID=129788 RepID=UPI00295AD0C7
MDNNSDEVTIMDSGNMYEGDSSLGTLDAQSDTSDENEIFHECSQIDGSVENTDDQNANTIGDIEAVRVGNIHIIGSENDKEPETYPVPIEIPVSSDVTVKDEVSPTEFETIQDLKSSRERDYFQFCDLCKEDDNYIISTAYCAKCDESYCYDCTILHRLQKATKSHEIGPPKSKKSSFVCELCKHLDIKIHAVASCRDCEELYCDTCSTAHKRQKATKNHPISCHDRLAERGTCEPCNDKGTTGKTACHICVDCDEVLCFDCFTVHIKQKATREHKVVCSEVTDQVTDQNYCQPCYNGGMNVTPDMYCRACSVKLCSICADGHRRDETSQNHKVITIPKFVGAEQGRLNANEVTQEDIHIQSKTMQDNLKPGIPCLVDPVKLDCVCLAWEPPKQVFKNMNYQLRYKEVDSNSKWILSTQVATQPSIIVCNLKSNTKYVFQVRMVSDEEEGPYSDASNIVETMLSAAARSLDFMYEVNRNDTEMLLKRLPLQENKKARNLTEKTRKLIIGEKNKTNVQERTVMLVGATGTGKSTLVDGMINYVLGVSWSDPYRLTLIDLEDEEINRDTNQAVSQTQWITCYTINPLQGSRLDYTLNIIDTPGFGDTRGIERDREIISQIRTLFSNEGETGIVFIDAICFLVKAPDARLTPTQRYIFNAIMSLFGHDIKDNFCILVTFADGKKPPVLSALREAKLPHELYFPFNNSGLFAENTSEKASNFASMFWEMGCDSFRLFFDKLKTMNTKSLQLTRDVLEQRELIELNIENLQPKLNAGLHKVDEISKEMKILEEFKTQIDDNSDFVYKVEETEQRQIDLPKGQHVTNCLTCNITCHKKCKIANDEKKRKCQSNLDIINKDMDGSESHNYDSDTCAEAELPDSPKVESGVDERSNDGHLINLENNKSPRSFPFSTEEGSPLKCDFPVQRKSFCDECSLFHCSQEGVQANAWSKNDCISPTKAPRAVFLCTTCSFMQHTNPATMSCKECEEVYCDTCSNVHRTQKATRTHTLSVHEDLPGKTMCEPCEYNGKENIEAVYLCIDCDEVQCTDCKSVHIKQKVTRGHTLILAFPDTDKLCDVCWKLGQQATPVKYCKVCFTKMCNKCAKAHREDSSATEHKLYDIKPQLSIKPVSTQVVQNTSNKQTVPEERPKVKKSVIDTTKPGKPCVVGQVSVDTVCLVWEPPTQLFENPNFQLRYKEADGSSKWRFYPDLAPSSTITLTNLKSDTHYIFQVRMVNDENEGSYSDISDTIGTIQSAAHHIMDFMYDVTAQDVNIPLKKIPFQENIKTRNEKAKTRKLII